MSKDSIKPFLDTILNNDQLLAFSDRIKFFVQSDPDILTENRNNTEMDFLMIAKNLMELQVKIREAKEGGKNEIMTDKFELSYGGIPIKRKQPLPLKKAVELAKTEIEKLRIIAGNIYDMEYASEAQNDSKKMEESEINSYIKQRPQLVDNMVKNSVGQKDIISMILFNNKTGLTV